MTDEKTMETETAPQGINNVLQLLAGVGYGGLVQDANEQLADVVAALRKRPGKGTVTLKLELERDPDSPRVEVGGGVTSTVPKGCKRSHTLYLAKVGGLSRNDPQQPMLPMAMQEQDEAMQEQHMRECAGMTTADAK